MRAQPNRIATLVLVAPQQVGSAVPVEVRHTFNRPGLVAYGGDPAPLRMEARVPDDICARLVIPPHDVGNGIVVEIAYANHLPCEVGDACQLKGVSAVAGEPDGS